MITWVYSNKYGFRKQIIIKRMECYHIERSKMQRIKIMIIIIKQSDFISRKLNSNFLKQMLLNHNFTDRIINQKCCKVFQ